MGKGFRSDWAETPKRRGLQADESLRSAAAGRLMPDPFGRRWLAFEDFSAPVIPNTSNLPEIVLGGMERGRNAITN